MASDARMRGLTESDLGKRKEQKLLSFVSTFSFSKSHKLPRATNSSGSSALMPGFITLMRQLELLMIDYSESLADKSKIDSHSPYRQSFSQQACFCGHEPTDN